MRAATGFNISPEGTNSEAAIVEADSREIEETILEARIVRWLNDHPAASLAGRCAWCNRQETADAILLPYGTEAGTHTWLHSECWPTWHAARRADALAAVSVELKEIRSTPPAEEEIQAAPLVSETTSPAASLDEPNAARRGQVNEIDGRFEHFCMECGRCAPFGYGVRLRMGQLGRWYCALHRPDRDAP
jgi:hypothetical protein